jgi:phosphoribosylanthranilate isomerase
MWNRDSTYTRIKLCWFEYLEAAHEASFIGVDALGFHILQDNRETWQKKAERFRTFLEVLPDRVEKVLLIDHSFDTTRDVLRIAPFRTIQLYPDWPSDEIIRLRSALPYAPKVIKVMSAQFSENDPADPDVFLRRYATCADAILLDSFRVGGTGLLADETVVATIVRESPIPVFLAGGLTAENVGARIRAVRPFGVDVETGVSDKAADGRMMKNLGKCREFVESVLRTDRDLLRAAAAQPATRRGAI